MNAHAIWIAVFAAALVLGAPGRAGALVTLYGPSGMDWDIYETTYGYIYDGENDAYDYCYYLEVNGTRYYASGSGATTIWSGRGVQMVPFLAGQIRVVRTAWVPETGSHDYLRYYDTFENTGSSAATVTVRYYGDLGSDTSTITTATSSGDTTVDLTDTWYCTHDSSSITTPAGHVWTDGVLSSPTAMSLSSDDISTSFSLDIPAGETRATMIFAVQGATRTDVQTTVEWLATVPEAALTGLTTTDEQQIVNWHTSGAPIITVVTAPEDLVVEEGGEVLLEVLVQDLEGDPFDVYWELTEDGHFDDGTGLTATFSAVGFDGPSTATVSVRAQDSAEERIMDIALDVLNALPVFNSDPAVDPGLDAYRGQEWRYQLDVTDPANVDGTMRDPVIVSVPVKPEGMIYFGDMHFEWTPRADGADVGLHTLRIEADDRDGEEGEVAVQEVVIEVLANAPPSEPTILSPAATTVGTSRPTLVVGNSTDIDGDPLSYTFQVAMVGDFLPSNVVTQGMAFEGPEGQTEWTVDTDLMDATRYYWRVWANDGRTDGPSSDSFFDVDYSLMPDLDPDGTTEDAVTDTILPFPRPEDTGCGCHVLASPGAGLPWVLVALAALALIRRRRG
jgi:MYXO-CTERM domain-containing protein